MPQEAQHQFATHSESSGLNQRTQKSKQKVNMQGKNLVGAATRYIAGRNAVQTVYWRGVNSSSDQQKFMKVLRTVQFAKP